MEINIPTIIFEILNFLLLSALLYFLLFRRVMRRVRAHAQEKERIMQELQAERLEVERLRSKIEARLANLDTEIDEIVSQARESLEEEHRSIIEAAWAETDRILKEARSEADQLQQRSLEEFGDRILDTIFAVSGNIIRQVAPRQAHNRLVEELNKRIWKLGQEEMERVETIRRSLAERQPVASIETAFELTPEQQVELARTMSALVDRDVELEIGLNSDLILGLSVYVGDTVIDHSVAAQLEGMRAGVEQSLQGDLLAKL